MIDKYMAAIGHPRPVGGGEQKFTLIFRNVQLLKNETLDTGSYVAVCTCMQPRYISDFCAAAFYPDNKLLVVGE